MSTLIFFFAVSQLTVGAMVELGGGDGSGFFIIGNIWMAVSVLYRKLEEK